MPSGLADRVRFELTHGTDAAYLFSKQASLTRLEYLSVCLQFPLDCHTVYLRVRVSFASSRVYSTTPIVFSGRCHSL